MGSSVARLPTTTSSRPGPKSVRDTTRSCPWHDEPVAEASRVFVDACSGRRPPFTPIWLNRQASRYMREYHDVKGDTPSLEFFKTPDLAARVALDAQRILGVYAAILFADLLPVM